MVVIFFNTHFVAQFLRPEQIEVKCVPRSFKMSPKVSAEVNDWVLRVT